MSPFELKFNHPVRTPYGTGRYQARVEVMQRGSDTEIADVVFLILPDSHDGIPGGILRGGCLPLPAHDVEVL